MLATSYNHHHHKPPATTTTHCCRSPDTTITYCQCSSATATAHYQPSPMPLVPSTTAIVWIKKINFQTRKRINKHKINMQILSYHICHIQLSPSYPRAPSMLIQSSIHSFYINFFGGPRIVINMKISFSE